MSEDKIKMTLMRAVREHLLLPGETLAHMREMWTKLTDKDKEDLTLWFGEIGVQIETKAAA